MNARNKILIVDDDPVNLDFFRLMLGKLGFTVEEAVDGLHALEKMEGFVPDIILLDNVMPNMSGWDLTKALKADERHRDIPIIMFSALDDVKDKLAGFELGVDDYITKPFNFSEVLARINAILRTRDLFAQIAMRESRLALAEELNRDVRHILSELLEAVGEVEAVVGAAGKTRRLREIADELNSRVGKTFSEWEDLKKNEIGLSSLKSEARKVLQGQR